MSDRHGIETLDTKEKREARQGWMELELRETWQDQAHSIGCSMDGQRYYVLHNGEVSEADFPARAAWVYTHQAERFICQTLVETVEVYTIFLAFNQGYVGGDPSILFETMVTGGLLNGLRQHYYTMEDALLVVMKPWLSVSSKHPASRHGWLRDVIKS